MYKSYRKKVWKNILVLIVVGALCFAVPSILTIADEWEERDGMPADYVERGLGQSGSIGESGFDAGLGHSEDEGERDGMPDAGIGHSEEAPADPIALIKPASGSGISLFSTPVSVNNFLELQSAVSTATSDLVVTFLQNVEFTNVIDIPAGRSIVLKGSGAGQTLTIASNMAGERHFFVRGHLILQAGVTLDGQIASQPAGGGIVLSPNDNASLRVEGGTIQYCSATAGGAVNISETGNMVMTGGEIVGCEAFQGGGVFVNGADSSKGLTMSGSATIRECKGVPKAGGTLSQGGGVFVSTGVFKMIDTSSIQDCTATGEGQGGGVFAAENSVMHFGDDSGSAPTITGCIAQYKFVGDSKQGLGGGIFASAATVTLYPNSKIADCHSSNNGGGIYTDLGATIVSKAGSLVSGCTAGNGGSIFVLNSTTLDLYGTVENGLGYYQGGGITVNNATATMWPSAVIRNCSAGVGGSSGTGWAGWGGGAYVAGGGTLLMKPGSTITDCQALAKPEKDWQENPIFTKSYGSGGGIFVDAGSYANLDGANITNNEAYRHGGGIFTRDYANVTTNSSVVFSGNTAAFYRIPADTVVNGSYPCTDAASISLDAAMQLEGRDYPLNNYDINHLSYLLIYNGHGGVDNTLPEPWRYAVYVEHFPYRSGDDGSAPVHTVYGNNRSNGDPFQFEKAPSDFETFTNYGDYAPQAEWFNTFGPVQARDHYPYVHGHWQDNPDQYTTQKTRTLNEMYQVTGLPQMEFTALWTKEVVIEKVLEGDHANLTKSFSISRENKQIWGHIMGVPLTDTFHMAHGDTKTMRMFDDTDLIVKEDAASADGYTVTYEIANFALQDNTLPIDARLENITVNPVKIKVVNKRQLAIPTGVKAEDSYGWALIGIGCTLAALGLVGYRRMRKYK